ncbi:MAG: SprB repeat-containing protein [Chitinophagales bacterium]
MTINLVGVDILCFGENTGEITSSSTGGVGGNEYLWSNGLHNRFNKHLDSRHLHGNCNRRQRRNRHG